MIEKEDSGDEHKFCTTLMEKTVGKIGILNSNLISDQFFFQCGGDEAYPEAWKLSVMEVKKQYFSVVMGLFSEFLLMVLQSTYRIMK